IYIRRTMLRHGGDGYIRHGFFPIPGIPQHQALAIGGDGDDEIGGGGEDAQAAVGAEVLGDELVVGAEAVDGAFFGGQEEAQGAEPGEGGGGVDAAAAVFFGADGQGDEVVGGDGAVFADDVDA